MSGELPNAFDKRIAISALTPDLPLTTLLRVFLLEVMRIGLLPLAWSPKKSVLHQTISAIRPESWEAVNRALLVRAKQDKLENGATVRSTAR